MVGGILMGYYKNREIVKPKHLPNDCVCDIVRKIVDAQNEVIENNSCATSCDRSIQQLRGKSFDTENTTIPFILYCSGSCEPFMGSGVFQAPATHDRESFFGCVETPVFRATQFVGNNNCCVRLELLIPISNGCEVNACTTNNQVCSFFPEDTPVTDFIATGICLTVNLKNFMGITCLDPINPIL